jgi:hypothetical protein
MIMRYSPVGQALKARRRRKPPIIPGRFAITFCSICARGWPQTRLPLRLVFCDGESFDFTAQPSAGASIN